MKPTRLLCHRCGHDTEWKTIRGGRAEVCSECGHRFPCASAFCGHGDCEDFRARWAPEPELTPGAQKREPPRPSQLHLFGGSRGTR